MQEVQLEGTTMSERFTTSELLKQPTLQSISVVVTLLPVVIPRGILDVLM